MRMEDVIVDGIKAAYKERMLLLLPVGKNVVRGLIFGAFLAVMIIVAGALSRYSALLYLLLSGFFLLLFLLFVMVGSFFDACLIGAVAGLLDGKRYDFNTLIDSGQSKWLRMFEVNITISGVLILLLCVFLLPLYTVLSSQAIIAPWMVLFYAALTFSAVFLAGIVFAPIEYLVVVEDLGLKGYLKASIGFVRDNLAATLIIMASSGLVMTIITSLASVVTGPMQLVPVVGPVLSVFLTMLLMVAVTAATEVMGAFWWIRVLRKS